MLPYASCARVSVRETPKNGGQSENNSTKQLQASHSHRTPSATRPVSGCAASSSPVSEAIPTATLPAKLEVARRHLPTSVSCRPVGLLCATITALGDNTPSSPSQHSPNAR